MINVVFMGTPDYAEQILKTLYACADIEIAAVYTQPDKKVGRKQLLTPPPVKVLAKRYGTRVLQPETLKNESVQEELCAIECDYIVVAAYGQILPKAVLEYRPCINLHASILPKYRGASPIQQALLNSDAETGVSAMLMDEGLDTGAVLKISKIAIDPDECADSLFKRLTEQAAVLTVDVLHAFRSLTPAAQDETQSSVCKKISRENGLVAFDNAAELYNKYRAYTPWPGIYLESGVKLKKIRLIETEGKHQSGEILAQNKESVQIGCSLGSIELFSLQPPSKKEMRVIDYINGKHLSVGNTLV